MFIYLASPYTPHNGEDIEGRVKAVAEVAADLMRQGHSVFSPIVHSHYISYFMDEALRLDHEFWMKEDLPILRAAGKVIILKLPGWDQSLGIIKEVFEAVKYGIPIELIEYTPS